MGYYKKIAIDIEEAVQLELNKGFDTYDEMFEVVQDISREYAVSSSQVMSLIWNLGVNKNLSSVTSKNMQQPFLTQT